MDPFTLHPRLAEDTVAVGQLPLCLVRLHRDARYPWLVLVPARAGVREIHELSREEQHRLVDEASTVSIAAQALFAAEKMNVAALGNMVPQLHVHVVARFASDAAWPGAIWGAHPALAYAPDDLEARLSALREALSETEGFVPEPEGGAR